MPRRIYWDSCVFLNWIEGVPEHLPMLDALFAEARNGDIEIHTSIVSLTEVAYAKMEKDRKSLDPAIEKAIDDMFAEREVVRVSEYHELIAREARRKVRQAITSGWALKPMDAIHLATAARLAVTEFHTYDEPLLKYRGGMGFPIQEPITQNPRLIPSE